MDKLLIGQEVFVEKEDGCCCRDICLCCCEQHCECMGTRLCISCLEEIPVFIWDKTSRKCVDCVKRLEEENFQLTFEGIL